MIALVTGVGRQKGIGAAICRELARRGYDIFFTYWSRYDVSGYPESVHDVEQITKELLGFGVKVESLELDLSKPESSTTLFREVTERLGAPDVLINNAAVSIRRDLLDIRAADLDEHYAVNVRATTLLCIEFVRQGKKGKIVNLTSGQALTHMKGELPYTITKAGIEMLTVQLATELSTLGIQIHAFDPGPTDTGWITDAMRESFEKSRKVNIPEEVAKAMGDLIDTEETGRIIHYGR